MLIAGSNEAISEANPMLMESKMYVLIVFLAIYNLGILICKFFSLRKLLFNLKDRYPKSDSSLRKNILLISAEIFMAVASVSTQDYVTIMTSSVKVMLFLLNPLCIINKV